MFSRWDVFKSDGLVGGETTAEAEDSFCSEHGGKDTPGDAILGPMAFLNVAVPFCLSLDPLPSVNQLSCEGLWFDFFDLFLLFMFSYLTEL